MFLFFQIKLINFELKNNGFETKSSNWPRGFTLGLDKSIFPSSLSLSPSFFDGSVHSKQSDWLEPNRRANPLIFVSISIHCCQTISIHHTLHRYAAYSFVTHRKIETKLGYRETIFKILQNSKLNIIHILQLVERNLNKIYDYFKE